MLTERYRIDNGLRKEYFREQEFRVHHRRPRESESQNVTHFFNSIVISHKNLRMTIHSSFSPLFLTYRFVFE